MFYYRLYRYRYRYRYIVKFRLLEHDSCGNYGIKLLKSMIFCKITLLLVNKRVSFINFIMNMIFLYYRVSLSVRISVIGSHNMRTAVIKLCQATQVV